MKTYKYIMILSAICTSLLFVQCDSDDNGNVIGMATCDDGVKNGDETGIDCGGDSCVPCFEDLDFSGTYVQQDIMGRPGVNTVFSGSDPVKNNFNTSIVSDRMDFQPTFLATLNAYHDAFGATYENNILGLDGPTFTTVLAQFDALQVAPEGSTVYYDPNTGLALTGRRLQDDVIDVSLVLSFGGTSGDRFDGDNGTPELVSDNVGFGDRVVGAFPYMESPK